MPYKRLKAKILKCWAVFFHLSEFITGGNSTDETIKLLKCTAALTNKDFWTYAQRLPHLFSVNGAFYEQVARDIGLEHGKHCTIASFEHKVCHLFYFYP